MLFIVLIIITHIRTSLCVKASHGRPVPNAEILDGLLSKFLGDSYSNNALFDFILGKPNKTSDASFTDSAGDNLDINILDFQSLTKIINFAKMKHDNRLRAKSDSSRRGNTAYPKLEAYEFHHPYIVNKSIDLMKQTIYMTQEKVNYTRKFRFKYRDNVAYQIALLYGAAAAMLNKMENLFTQMKKLPSKTHFIFFLILYEKILASSIDVGDTIEKLFMIQEVDERASGGKKKGKKRLNLTADDLKELMHDPVRMEVYMKQHGLSTLGRRSGRRRGRN